MTAQMLDEQAEKQALVSGRPKSQERTELAHPETAGDGWRCLCGEELDRRRLGKKKIGSFFCPRCDKPKAEKP